MFNESNELNQAFNVRLSNGTNYPLSREMVYCFFDVPAVEAARIMCVSLSLLKKIRAWVKVERWPCSLIHSGEFVGLTRDQIVHGRNEVIAGLERSINILDQAQYRDPGQIQAPGQMYGSGEIQAPGRIQVSDHNQNITLDGIKQSLKILMEVRRYAAIYICLVIPDAGRRQSTKRREEDLKTQELNDGMRAKEIMESMQPRQVAQRKTKISVVTTVEPEDSFWPISITQEFNFDQLFASDELEDELKLGPMTLSAKVSTTVVMERGGVATLPVNRPATVSNVDEDFGFLRT